VFDEASIISNNDRRNFFIHGIFENGVRAGLGGDGMSDAPDHYGRREYECGGA
jgi:hypothetical protein